MAEAAHQSARRTSAEASALPLPPAARPDPADRAAWLAVIRALARQAARADHAAEEGGASR